MIEVCKGRMLRDIISANTCKFSSCTNYDQSIVIRKFQSDFLCIDWVLGHGEYIQLVSSRGVSETAETPREETN